ncbi:DUF4974 domain-containing protein [Marinilabiliaceae bacterium JC017]|nr:DUF4974 domain-containing protein [Marinilabiliaceae bacterium JC017]
MIRFSKNIKEAITRYVHGSSSVDELQALGEWLSSSDENKDKFRKLSIEAGDELLKENAPEVDACWQNFYAQYLVEEKKPARKMWLTLQRVAAIFVIALTAGIVGWYQFSFNKTSEYESFLAKDVENVEDTRLIFEDGQDFAIADSHSDIEIAADGKSVAVNEQERIDKGEANQTDSEKLTQLIVPYGKTSKLVLADGTNVWLNAGSRLIFPMSFKKKNREVYLEGEAFFDVTHNEKQPFVVKTSDMHFRVLGTCFNINSFSKNNKVEAVLVKGSLQVENKAFIDKKQVVLVPGQKSEFVKSEERLTVHEVNTKYYTSWKEGYLLMKKRSLSEVVSKLENYYNLKVVMDEGISDDAISISGKLVLSKNIEKVFGALCDLSDLKYYTEGEKIYLKEAK